MSTLTEKISETEAFERTPAGAALNKYTRALSLAAGSDSWVSSWEADRIRDDCRMAEQELIAEIRRLQDKAK